ncbi:MAG: NAD-binding protein [Proteobacteria bacterium]|nr:NAD-binding protein [Pseudomonadota bacterium]
METIWIIGAGRFGRLAVNRLRKQFHMVIVDTDESRLRTMEGTNLTLVQSDGVKYLADNLDLKADIVSWIIPSLPVHLAWEWIRRKSGPTQLKALELPDTILSLLPHPMRGQSSHIYVSHADFICPDNCNEPDLFCTHTKKPRQQNMYQLLESLSFEAFQPLVVKSRQLAPGVGGYRSEDLYNLSDKIGQVKGSLLICTACRCHGVITGAIHQ